MQYRSTDFVAPGPGKLQLVYTPANGGEPTTMNVYDFKGPGVAMSMYNTDDVSVALISRKWRWILTNSQVDFWVRTFIVQDGAPEKDAFGRRFTSSEGATYGLCPLVLIYEEHHHEEI